MWPLDDVMHDFFAFALLVWTWLLKGATRAGAVRVQRRVHSPLERLHGVLRGHLRGRPRPPRRSVKYRRALAGQRVCELRHGQHGESVVARRHCAHGPPGCKSRGPILLLQHPGGRRRAGRGRPRRPPRRRSRALGGALARPVARRRRGHWRCGGVAEEALSNAAGAVSALQHEPCALGLRRLRALGRANTHS